MQSWLVKAVSNNLLYSERHLLIILTAPNAYEVYLVKFCCFGTVSKYRQEH